MAPKIDFYLIPDTTPEDTLTFACRVCEKAYQNGHNIHIHTQDAAQANSLNQKLWSFRDISFLPHELQGENKGSPITLGHQSTLPDAPDILINLSLEIPEFITQFNRIIEIVPQNNELEQISRKHYKHYSTQNFTIDLHDLRNKL